MKVFKFLFAALLAALPSAAFCAHTYKVADAGGIPRIFVDGKPVRARMLYVSPTYFMLGKPFERTACETPAELSFDISPLEKPPVKGSVKISPHAKSFGFEFFKLEVVEADSGKSVYLFDPEKNPDAAMLQPSAAAAESVSRKIVKRGGKTALRVASNNAPKYFHVYFGGLRLEAGKKYKVNLEVRADEPRGFMLGVYDGAKFLEPQVRSRVGEQVKIAAEAGVDFITFPVQAEDFFVESGETPDYSRLDGAIKEIVSANPQAKILVRIRFYPPKKWFERHPDGNMVRDDGRPNGYANVSSKIFRDDSVKALRLIIRHCEKLYGENIAGYHPGGGGSCEWYYGGSGGPWWTGYDEPTRSAWRAWLKKTYKNDAALGKSWRREVSISTAEVPSLEARKSARFVCDPSTQRDIADFNLFLQDEMVDMIEVLAATIRAEVPDKLSAFFYGYACEFAHTIRQGAAGKGHYALGRLLKSKNVDILCGPISYEDRNVGFGGSTMGMTDSVARAGKLWISEDDTRTWLVPATQQQICPLGCELKTRADTILVLQRDMAHQAIRQNGSWWMDLAGTGWYADPELWKLKPAFAPMEEDIIKNPVQYSPDIAVVADERSVCFGGASNSAAITTGFLRQTRFDVNRLGATFGYYLFDDCAFGAPLSPKLWVFAVNYSADARGRAAMAKMAADAAAIYAWIPAYVDVEKNEFSEDAVREATGFEVKRAIDGLTGRVYATAEGLALGLPQKFGTPQIVKPLLVPKVVDGDIVYARYSNGEPAFVLRGKKLFCGVADVPLPLYKKMVEISGAHIWSKKPSSVYACGGYASFTLVSKFHLKRPVFDDVSAHRTPEPVEIDTGYDGEIFDALTGEKLGKGPKLVLKMRLGDNVVMRFGKGNVEFLKK